MPDRKTPPEIVLPQSVEIPTVQKIELTNGIPVHIVNAGMQEVAKIEWVWNAGKALASKPLVANAVNSLIEEGTTERSSRQISEEIDYYGAVLNSTLTDDTATLTLFSRNDQLDRVLPVFCDVAANASFPEEEISIFKKNKLQEFIVSLEQTEVLSRRALKKKLFGNHPYGMLTEAHDFETIERDELQKFYNQHYTTDNGAILISGKIDEAVIQLLDKTIGTLPKTESKGQNRVSEANLNLSGKEYVARKGAVQSSIRMAFPTPPVHHEDHFPMRMLITLFGGYFGSRLMMNIREDKGYTYGVGTRPIEKAHASYIGLATQVGAHVTDKALEEIYREMQKLREEAPSDYEMETVRNYMVGSVLKSLDGPFAIEAVYKSLYLRGLNLDYMKEYLSEIKQISAEDIRRVASKYLVSDSVLEVVAGPEQH